MKYTITVTEEQLNFLKKSLIISLKADTSLESSYASLPMASSCQYILENAVPVEPSTPEEPPKEPQKRGAKK